MSKDAYISIIAGLDEGEANDWAWTLVDMYHGWAEAHDLAFGIIDHPFQFVIREAYDKLKRETGIHRRVRRSPLDPARRRHTAFASVRVGETAEHSPQLVWPDGMSQLRSYVLDPYQLVTDHRTEIKVPDVDGVLSGRELDLLLIT